ncbi:FkbM family methyltransferase [Mongoliitalea daihaiensis]|uniref:FkbM family methyltransferase n=1 Tax=Mongoliitalea daihaiensis TaxID=2782006 RepID=UPI001EFFDA23|nr:FkbM family methyltransferase [Mongoliitalea daihaiensis]UJP65999.1 FkbM family methyltransferase [Mongoliitalea daihaiensis]
MPFLKDLIDKFVFTLGSPQQIFMRRIKTSALIKSFQEKEGVYQMQSSISQHPVFLRGGSSSDVEVFEQIFNFQEYAAICTLLSANNIAGPILDLGANIGLSSIYYSTHVDNSPIFAVEPDPENFNILTKNIQSYPHIHGINCSISHEENMRFAISDDFRDGKDWSKTVKASAEGSILGITIPQLIQQYGLTEIALLKMDIEGYEKFIFEQGDLSFLSIVKLIAVEVHEEFISKSVVYEQLKAFGFIVWESGELVIGLKATMD